MKYIILIENKLYGLGKSEYEELELLVVKNDSDLIKYFLEEIEKTHSSLATIIHSFNY